MMRFISFLAFFAMTACSGNTDSDFLCSSQIGLPCSTIAQADGLRTSVTLPVAEFAEDTAMNTLSQEPLSNVKLNGSFGKMLDGGYGYESERYRVPEMTGRLWIAPYLDGNEILHESRYVHFVIRDAHWKHR